MLRHLRVRGSLLGGALRPCRYRQFEHRLGISTLLQGARRRQSQNPQMIRLLQDRVKAGVDTALYAYIREKGDNKVAVILNLSAKPQEIQILDQRMTGEPMNLFMGVKEVLSINHHVGIEPWGYIVYVYK